MNVFEKILASLFCVWKKAVKRSVWKNNRCYSKQWLLQKCFSKLDDTVSSVRIPSALCVFIYRCLYFLCSSQRMFSSGWEKLRSRILLSHHHHSWPLKNSQVCLVTDLFFLTENLLGGPLRIPFSLTAENSVVKFCYCVLILILFFCCCLKKLNVVHLLKKKYFQ